MKFDSAIIFITFPIILLIYIIGLNFIDPGLGTIIVIPKSTNKTYMSFAFTQERTVWVNFIIIIL